MAELTATQEEFDALVARVFLVENENKMIHVHSWVGPTHNDPVAPGTLMLDPAGARHCVLNADVAVAQARGWTVV